MKAGEKLDALVAEKVMGWKKLTFIHRNYLCPSQLVDQVAWAGSSWKHGWTKGNEYVPDWGRIFSEHWAHIKVPEYSTDIAAAWTIVGKFKRAKVRKNPKWEALLWEDDLVDGAGFAHGETASHAICLAALESVKYPTGRAAI